MEILHGRLGGFIFFTKRYQKKARKEHGFKGKHVFGISIFLDSYTPHRSYCKVMLLDECGL